MKRVSTGRPSKANSFQNRVPTGNSQASGSEASMTPPSGRDIHRRFVAPSVQSGYWGAKKRWAGSASRAAKSL
jgi:hypothetical protein